MSIKSKILCLTLSYATNKSKNHIVHFENVALNKAGYDVSTITHHLTNISTDEIMDSIHIHRYRYLPIKYEFNTNQLSDEIKSSKKNFLKAGIMSVAFFFFTFKRCMKDKPDVILAHWIFPSGFIAYVMFKFFKIPYIIASHGGEKAPLEKLFFFKKFAINALNNAHLIILNGKFNERELKSFGMTNPNTTIVFGPPNYVKHSRDPKILENFKQQFVNNQTKIILFVGRLIELKGVEYLIRSMKHVTISDTKLLLVGIGNLESSLRQLTTSLNLDDQVIFYGHAGANDLGLLYDVSDVLVCPSIITSDGLIDAMPLVIPESMESKLPVIGTRTGGIPDMIKNEYNGLLVDEKSPIQIANCIDRILSDTNFRNMLIKNSQEYVKLRSRDSTAQGYVKSVNQILNNDSI